MWQPRPSLSLENTLAPMCGAAEQSERERERERERESERERNRRTRSKKGNNPPGGTVLYCTVLSLYYYSVVLSSTILFSTTTLLHLTRQLYDILYYTVHYSTLLSSSPLLHFYFYTVATQSCLRLFPGINPPERHTHIHTYTHTTLHPYHPYHTHPSTFSAGLVLPCLPCPALPALLALPISSQSLPCHSQTTIRSFLSFFQLIHIHTTSVSTLILPTENTSPHISIYPLAA